MYFVIVEKWRRLNANPGLNSYPVFYWAVILNCILDRKYGFSACLSYVLILFGFKKTGHCIMFQRLLQIGFVLGRRKQDSKRCPLFCILFPLCLLVLAMA